MTDENKTATQEPEFRDGLKLEKGKVYLRDKRNGKLFQYEENLARMHFIEPYVHGDENAKVELDAPITTTIESAQAKAAAWDEQARKNLKPKQVTTVATEEASTGQQIAPQTPPTPPATPPAPPASSTPGTNAGSPPAPPAAPATPPPPPSAS